MELTKSDNGKWKPGQSGNLQGRPVGTFVPRIGQRIKIFGTLICPNPPRLRVSLLAHLGF
jgi:hypothetical protein